MKDECRHVRLTRTIPVSMPSVKAFSLFTPSGERAWVEEWNPIFPASVSDETEPGTVFETDHGGTNTIWVVARCEPGVLIEYARITPGDRAGLVTVVCAPAGDNDTLVTVTYELTALSPEANAALDDFAEGYADFMDHWRLAIQGAVDAK